MKLFQVATLATLLILLAACGGSGATPFIAQPANLWEVHDPYRVVPTTGTGYLLEVSPSTTPPEYFGNVDVLFYAVYKFQNSEGETKVSLLPYLGESKPYIQGFEITETKFFHVYPVEMQEDVETGTIKKDADAVMSSLCAATSDCQ